MKLNVQHVSLTNSLYLLRPVCIFKSVQRVLISREGWAYIRNHDSPAVATERVLKQPSELTVSVRNVAAFDDSAFSLVTEGIDAVAKSQKTLVNICTLDKSQTPVICVGSSFRSGQIYQTQLSNVNLSVNPVGLVLVLHCYLQHCVRTGRCLVGVSTFLCSCLVSLDYVLHDLIGVGGHNLHDSGHTNALDTIFSQLEWVALFIK